MSNNQKWIFYDSFSKTQSNPISLEEAQMALFKMSPRDWTRFYIWTEGWDNWQPLELFLKSDQRYFVTQFAANAYDDTVKFQTVRDVLEMTSADEATQKEVTKSFSGVAIKDEPSDQEPAFGKSAFDGDELTWDHTKKSDLDFTKLQNKSKYDRRSERMNLKIEILLVSPKGNIFRSASQNISLTGSRLDDNIPFDYYGIVFDIIVLNNISTNKANSRVSLKAVTVGDGLTQRLSYFEMNAVQKKSLQGLLQDYLDHQSKLNKKTS